mmetsp:Transcript_15543/g.21462  ORF Transcript_15543/g.21462 Transcript_15543/m.21462 type:complete len:242 (+) Transcript_15543:430-1155(+)
MRALDIVRNNLQVGFEVDCGPGRQEEVAGELLGVSLLRQLVYFHVPVEHASPARLRHYALVQLVAGRVGVVQLQAGVCIQHLPSSCKLEVGHVGVGAGPLLLDGNIMAAELCAECHVIQGVGASLCLLDKGGLDMHGPRLLALQHRVSHSRAHSHLHLGHAVAKVLPRPATFQGPKLFDYLHMSVFSNLDEQPRVGDRPPSGGLGRRGEVEHVHGSLAPLARLHPHHHHVPATCRVQLSED